MSKSVVRLQLDHDGTVWVGTDHDVAVHSGVTPGVFLALELKKIQELSEIQLFGSIRNASLIELLYLTRLRGGLPDDMPIRLGSPAGGRLNATCPELLQTLWRQDLIEGPGFRWINMSQCEYSSYALITNLVNNNWQVNDACRKIIRYHPAWPALSFIPTLDIDSACVLVAVIVDPRWFIQPFRPNRIGKLCNFLGLTPRNMTFIDGKTTIPDKNFERCSIIMQTWAKDPTSEDGEITFLHRIFRDDDSWSRGMLSACKRFVRFIREVWLSELLRHKKLFDPDMFFKGDGEAARYRTHYAAARKRTARDTCT